MQTLHQRWSRLSVLALTMFIGGLSFWMVPSAYGAQAVAIRRLGVTDLYATSRLMAQQSFPTGASVALLARGDEPSDALAGNYLAGNPANNGPILLTEPNSLHPHALAALRKLNVRSVGILGGPEAISPAVEQDLKKRGFQTIRYAGANRYATAKVVAESLGVQGVGDYRDEPTAILVGGEAPADALAAGPLSFKARFPTLLTTPRELSSEAAGSLSTLKIERVLIVGNTTSVSTGVESTLREKGLEVQRLAGGTPQATALVVAQFARDQLGFSKTHVGLARADVVPASLSGGPYAGRLEGGAPILFIADANNLGADARKYLNAAADTITTIDGLGGPEVISDAALTQAKAAATCTPPPATPAASLSSLVPTTTVAGPRPCPPGAKPAGSPAPTSTSITLPLGSPSSTTTPGPAPTPTTPPTPTPPKLPCPPLPAEACAIATTTTTTPK